MFSLFHKLYFYVASDFTPEYLWLRRFMGN